MGDEFVLEVWVTGRSEPIRTTVEPSEMTPAILDIAANPAAARRVWPAGEFPTADALADREKLGKEFAQVLGSTLWRLGPTAGFEVWGGPEAFSIRAERVDFIKVIDLSEIPPPRKRVTGFSFAPE